MGTTNGGKHAAARNIEKYGADFYKRIGSMGGKKKGCAKGFASPKVGVDGLTGKQRASKVGSIGGKISRRRRALYDLGKL